MSIHPATTETHGPVRKVVALKPYKTAHGDESYTQEVLECGHAGKLVKPPLRPMGKRRRCWTCQWRVLKGLPPTTYEGEIL